MNIYIIQSKLDLSPRSNTAVVLLEENQWRSLRTCDCFGESSFVETHWVGPATNCHSTQSLEAFWSVARYFRCTLEALLVKSLPVCEKLLGRMQPRWCEKMQMERRYDFAVLARDVLASQSRKPIAAIMLEHWINVHQLVKVSDPYLPKQTCSPKML